MKFNKRKLLILTTLLSAFFAINFSFPVKGAIFTPRIQSRAAILVNQNTGQVIASKNDRKRYPIASISKLIVIYMVEERLHEGKIKRTDTVKITKPILKFSHNTKVANVPMYKSNKYTIDDLEKAALLSSSNSAAMALAEKVSGSQSNYYHDAEKLLASWGIKNVEIYSSSGLNNGDMGELANKSISENAENELSAREVAIVASKLLDKFPNILNITQMTKAKFPGVNGRTQKIETTVSIIGHSQYDFKGLKTGSYREGYNFVGYGKLKNQPVITVIFNNRNLSPFSSTEDMMNQANDDTKTLNSKVNQVKVLNASTKDSKVTVKPEKSSLMFVPNKFDQSKLNVSFKKEKGLTAPLHKNEVVGMQKFKFQDSMFNDFIEPYSKTKYVTKNYINGKWIILSLYSRLVNLL